jgi:hypothetical protein
MNYFKLYQFQEENSAINATQDILPSQCQSIKPLQRDQMSQQ